MRPDRHGSRTDHPADVAVVVPGRLAEELRVELGQASRVLGADQDAVEVHRCLPSWTMILPRIGAGRFGAPRGQVGYGRGMGKLIYAMNVSLDGFVDTVDRRLDWIRMDD